MKTLDIIREQRNKDNLEYCMSAKNIAEIRSQYSWLVRRMRSAILNENEEQYQTALNLTIKTVRKYIDYKAAIMRGLY